MVGRASSVFYVNEMKSINLLYGRHIASLNHKEDGLCSYESLKGISQAKLVKEMAQTLFSCGYEMRSF
jgi:hypothetical protein